MRGHHSRSPAKGSGPGPHSPPRTPPLHPAQLGSLKAPGSRQRPTTWEVSKGKTDREPRRRAPVTSQPGTHGSLRSPEPEEAHLSAVRQGGLSCCPHLASCPRAASGCGRKCSFRKTGSPAPSGRSGGRCSSAVIISERLGSRRCGQTAQTQRSSPLLCCSSESPEPGMTERRMGRAGSSLLVITEASYKSCMRFSSTFIDNLPRRKPVVVTERSVGLIPQKLGEEN